MIQSSEFTGWVEKIFDKTTYGREFTVRDYKDNEDPNKPKFPTVLKFKCTSKIMNMIDGIREGDKVRVRYFVYGKSGYGQKGYYCIVNLNVAKEGGITLIEAAPRNDEAVPNHEEEIEESSEDIPF